METIIIAALGGLLVNALSGVVGNRADAAVTTAWKAIFERIKKGGKPVNLDLQRAVLRSFILALKTVCDDCINELKTKKKEYAKDIGWLEQKGRSLDEELKRTEKADYVEPSLDSLNEIELLLLPNGTLAKERIQKVKAKLINAATRDGELPGCYKEKTEKELFQRMCAYFAFEIKNNQVIHNIVEGQLLAQIDLRLQGQQLTVERIETSLFDIAKAVPQVMGKLNAIDIAIQEVRDRVDVGFEQLIMVVAMSATGVDEIKANISSLAADVKTILGAKKEEPKISDDIQNLLIEAKKLRDSGKYKDAKDVLQKTSILAEDHGDGIAKAEVKYLSAVILYEWDHDSTSAKSLLQECLSEFKAAKTEKRAAKTLYQLGVLELNSGRLDDAKAYLTQALELDQKCDDKISIAQDLHQLGWIEDHRGHFKEALDFYNQALTYFLSVYQEGDPESEKDAIHGIAACYHHKGLIYEHLGNVEEVESNYMRSLEWYRKTEFKPDIGKTLYLLARLKYREAQYDAGTQFLDEAMQIYNEIGDYGLYARCLHLKGQLHFTLGQTDKATTFFESALDAIEKSGDHKGKESYLNILGDVYLKTKKLEKAKGYFEQARDLSLRHELLDGYAASVENLAQIAHAEKNLDERNRLLSDGIQTLEKLLLSVEAESRRAFITGQIGFFYEKMENFQQALAYYQKALKAFESLSDLGGIANCLGSIARMKGLLGKKNEEYDTYRELKKCVDGSPYYDLVAGTAINLGEIQMQIGNLDDAKMLFQEAELLCLKYNLHYLPHVRESIRRLQEQINLRKPPELNFRQLMEELFELINWFPEAKDSIFRLWMWGRKEALLGNFRIISGIKFMICQDDVDTFLRTSKVLHPYSDLSLQVISSEYPGSGIDIIPFPMDKEIFFDCGIPYKTETGGGVYKVGFVSGGINSRYQLTAGTTVRSKITGNEGVTITGWSLGLPGQAHQIILSSSAAELTGQKIFFLPYERHLANDKLLSDLRLSKELGLIPVYFDSLPNSESVDVMTSATVNIPVLLPDETEHQRKQIRKVKRSLYQLLSGTKDSAQSSLNDFVFEVEELSDSCKDSKAIEIKIYILQFPSALDRVFHIVLVISEKQMIAKENSNNSA